MIKTLKIRMVSHVGEIDFTKKRLGSYEGSGLSVSNCPDAWKKINKGNTVGKTHYLFNENGLMLDYHRTVENPHFFEKVKQWGLKHGYIEKTILYNIYMYDDCDERICETYLSQEEAESCMVDYDIEETDYEIDKDGYIGTEKLIKESFSNSKILTYPKQLLIAIYTEKELTHLDGIWWEDDLDIYGYSAPRGVIFNEKLKDWLIKDAIPDNFEFGQQDIIDTEDLYF